MLQASKLSCIHRHDAVILEILFCRCRRPQAVWVSPCLLESSTSIIFGLLYFLLRVTYTLPCLRHRRRERRCKVRRTMPPMPRRKYTPPPTPRKNSGTPAMYTRSAPTPTSACAAPSARAAHASGAAPAPATRHGASLRLSARRRAQAPPRPASSAIFFTLTAKLVRTAGIEGVPARGSAKRGSVQSRPLVGQGSPAPQVATANNAHSKRQGLTAQRLSPTPPVRRVHSDRGRDGTARIQRLTERGRGV